jgi:acyl-CoA thioesterase-1
MAHARSITVVHMGDSITFGQYLDPALRWTTIVESRLVRLFGDDVDILVFNRGISGETTRMGLERFPSDVQALEPDVVTLQFGLNDCNCWETDRGLPRVSDDAFRANLVEMIERARAFGARSVLSTNHCTLRYDTLPSGEIYEDANARYSEIARSVAEETGVELCDIRGAFEPFADAELARLLLPAPDLLHLSAEGNKVYADVIWPYVEREVENALQRERVIGRR